MPRAIQYTLLALIAAACVLVIVRLSEYKVYFAQHNATTYVVQLLAIFVVYAIAILLASRFKGPLWAGSFKLAMIFGLASGLMEILTIAGENNISVLRIPALVGMFGVFVVWGIAGFWATIRLKSIKSGLLTSIASAAICMLIGVCGGIYLEMFLAIPDPASVITWQEFKRSGWTDPRAFQIANTLDSAFDHLFFAPLVAAVFGMAGSGVGRAIGRG